VASEKSAQLAQSEAECQRLKRLVDTLAIVKDQQEKVILGLQSELSSFKETSTLKD
jgi:hypothetical protein